MIPATAPPDAAATGWRAIPAFWRLQIAGWGLFALFDLATRLLVFEDTGTALRVTAVVEPVMILLAVLLCTAYDRLGFEGRITARTVGWTLALSLAAAVPGVVVSLAVRHPDGFGPTGLPPIREVLVPFLYYLMIFLGWSLACFWVRAELARRSGERRAALAEADALRAELQRLRLQLDPHFLFNALNGIAEEVPEHPKAALAMLRDLTAFLRHSFAGIDRVVMTVDAEAEALACWLRVQEARFGPRLAARLDVDEAARPRPIASFLLQPLVENAVQHGDREDRLDLSVAIRAEPDALLIEIRNTGALAPRRRADGRAGIGLANVRRRLALHYPGRHAFTLGPEGAEVVARLRLEGDPCSAS